MYVRGSYCGGMRDPEEDDPPARDRGLGFSSNNLRRKLGEGLAGLLDPEGAIGKGKELVTGVTQATKNEVVRMVSAEVRQFLDGMDAVELLQRVVAGLVIDVKAEIRFSIDPEGALKSTVKTKNTAVREENREPTAPRETPREASREAPREPNQAREPQPGKDAREPKKNAPEAKAPSEPRPGKEPDRD